MTYTGRCNCGSVTVAISAGPIAVRQCWCRQCQKAAAGSATNNAIFPLEAVALSGETATWNYVADSGNAMTHTFCARCGSPVMAQSSARPHLRTFRIGMIDEPHDLRPSAVIWTDEAPAWAVFDPALEQFARQPPPPPAPK